jgi:Flp pilus assembly protein TadG
VRRDDGGQSLVEFALILPVLLVLLVGLFDLGRAVTLSETMNAAVREGARFAIVHGATSSSPLGPSTFTSSSAATDNAITAVVRRHATGVNSTLTIVVSWPDGDAKRGSEVIVTATTAHVPIVSQVAGGGLAVTLRGSAVMVIQQ